MCSRLLLLFLHRPSPVLTLDQFPSCLSMTSKNDLGIFISVYHGRIDWLAIDSRNRHHLPPLPRRSLFVCRNHSLRRQSLDVKASPTKIPPQLPSLKRVDSLLDCDHDEGSSGTRQSCRSFTYPASLDLDSKPTSVNLLWSYSIVWDVRILHFYLQRT